MGFHAFAAAGSDARLLPERLHGVALHLQVSRDVAARRGDSGMAEIVADHRDVGSGIHEPYTSTTADRIPRRIALADVMWSASSTLA